MKPLSKFGRDATRPTGHHPYCLDCAAENSSKFQDPEAPLNGYMCPVCDTPVRGNKQRRFDSETCKTKVKALKAKYGMEIADYRRLVDSTQGRCPICLKRPTQWHVDHRHSDGLAFGATCNNCNTGALAMTFHDPEFVERLLDYLRNPPTQQLGIQAYAPQSTPSRLHQVWQTSRTRGRRA